MGAGLVPAQFSEYWHQGQAEVNRYEIERLRYGEMRSGYAVLIFVTEDLLRDKQVKDEAGAGDRAINVLKLNRIERFATGLYDYSLMLSTFTEAEFSDPATPPRGRSPTLKFTASVQDWCGHVWLQGNRVDDEFTVVGHSYFEREGDERTTLPAVLLEDEVFTQIRLGAERLPTGEVRVLPSAFRIRLDHMPLRAVPGQASLQDVPRTPQSHVPEREYRLVVSVGAAQTRTLTVRFGAGFPFNITSIEERLGEPGGQGTLIYRATLAKSEKVDYWAKNQTRDEPLRAHLGLAPVR
jgi:hypothetical protein